MSLLKIFFITTLFMAGCSESIHTEKYYKDHPKERTEKLQACKALDAMNVAQKEECQNAFRADRKHGEIIDSTKYNYKY
jgi:PBP1b-binding outer membrane lipoprotein LpoB